MMARNKAMAYGMGAVRDARRSGHRLGPYTHTSLPSFGSGAVAAWGLLFGFVHYLMVGMEMGMGMMGTMHPLLHSGQMQAPGLFVRNLPQMTVMGFLMLHLITGWW